MQPWSSEELERLKQFFAQDFPVEDIRYKLVVDPLSPENNSIPLSYFSGSLPADAIQTSASQIEPATDDRPYFNLSEKSLNPFSNGISQSLKGPVENLPQGLITLYMTGIVAVFYALIFLLCRFHRY